MHIKTSNQEELSLGFGEYTCNWGVHICGLYETAEERDDIIFSFFHQGAKSNDKQLFSPAEQTAEDFTEKYKSRYPEFEHHILNPDLFSVINAKELYYSDGTFSPITMDENLEKFFTESQKFGRRNIRASAEMVWALEKIPGIEHLMAYESRLNYFISGKPWISICLYNITKFSGKTIMNVLQTHPYTITGGVIIQNPYYIDPDEWLKQNDPEFAIK